MIKKFLELDEKKARFFEYSKEAKEGFEAHKTDTGKESFRKYYEDGAIGILKFINEREEEFKNGKVKKLSLVMDNGDDRLYLNFNILTAKGNMNQFIEQFVPFLPSLKAGSTYRIYPYEMPSEYVGSDGVKRTGVNNGVSVYNYDLPNQTKLDKVDRAHSFGANGDIPGVKWEKEEDMGVIKNIKNDKERRNFLYQILKNSLTSDNPAPIQQAPVATQAAKPKTEAALPFSEEEQDDLPF